MRLLLPYLQKFIAAPLPDVPSLRLLLDDVGIEVKRTEETPDGTTFSFEFLANRGDHRCYLGVARELAGRLQSTVRFEPPEPLRSGDAPIPVAIESDDCLIYSATEIALGRQSPLPSDLTAPLRVAGYATDNVVVAVTNLVNLEIGQPVHAFDADRIEGTLRIRLSHSGERAWLLGEPAPRELPGRILVIADDNKILAIAGVIGCEESRVIGSTRRILLESGTFDAVAVRKAARALAVQTDASARFERAGDPALPLVAAARVVDLLRTYAGVTVPGESYYGGKWKNPGRVINLSSSLLSRWLGREFDVAEIHARLTAYGFTVESESQDLMRVQVPTWRLWDVHNPEDLYEELARAVSYNALPTQIPPVTMGVGLTEQEEVRHTVEEILLGAGYTEIFTDGFYSRNARALLGIAQTHPLWNHVETVNAVDSAFSLLKNNCLVQALEVVKTNARLRVDELRCFEWTRTFHPDAGAPNGLCKEREMLWLVGASPIRGSSWKNNGGVSLWHLKRIVEEIATELRIHLTVEKEEPSLPMASLLHPFRQATICLDGRIVGIFGEVHPVVRNSIDLKGTWPYYLEIEAGALRLGEWRRNVEPPSPYQDILRTLSLTLPPRLQAAQVARHLRKSGPEWLASVRVVDVFEHGEDEHQVTTVTFELCFRNTANGRSAEQINTLLFSLIDSAKEAMQGLKLR